MLRDKAENERGTGKTGKLIREADKSLDTGSLKFCESLLEYYMPGFDHKNSSDEEFAIKLAHLRRIRQDESKTNPLNALFKRRR